MEIEDERSFLARPLQEVHQQPSVETAVQVFTVSADGPAGPLIGGTIAVVSGLRGSALLERARVLAASEDTRAIGELLQQWRDAPGAFTRGTEPGGTAVTQVSYGGRVIVDGLLVHAGMDALVALLPYAGGALNDQAFTARSWAPSLPDAPDVETVVICRPPKLTQLEERVLATLPDDVEAAVIGRPPTLAWPGADAAEQMLLAARVQEIADIDDRLRAMEDRFVDLRQADDDVDRGVQDLRAQIQELMDGRDRAEAVDLMARQQDLEAQLVDQRMARANQVELLQQQRDRLLDDLGERMADRQRFAQNDDDDQRERQEEQRQRDEEQRERQQRQEEQQRRQREEQERNEDFQRRQDEAAEADHADVGDDDDGGSVGEWLDRLGQREVVAGLDAHAAVNVLLEIRGELLRRGAVR